MHTFGSPKAQSSDPFAFISNTVKSPNLVIGDYACYDNPEDSKNFGRNARTTVRGFPFPLTAWTTLYAYAGSHFMDSRT